MDAKALHERARTRGVNPALYWVVRAVLQPFFRLVFRMQRHGREHLPAAGPLILAANHRSFLDPFVLACMSRRPVYYVAKKELFSGRLLAWVLNSLGAFPVDRGAADQEMFTTARAILARGDCVLIFPEGTRVRPGGLGEPRRGVGRLALESGAPVVPLAVLGTEDIRRGWRIRPRRVTVRAGRPLTFPRVEQPSPQLAQAVTDRIWPCVALQWEWLGGLPPLRRAAVIGAGARGAELARTLRAAGLSVELGTRTREHAERLRAGDGLAGITVARAAELELEEADLVVLAVPSRALPHVLAQHGERIAPQAGLVVVQRGLVPALGALPSAFVAERAPVRGLACLGGPGGTVVAARDRAFAARLASVLRRAGVAAERSDDLTGVELAGVAQQVAAYAAAAAAPAGPQAAGIAAARVFAEAERYARAAGAHPQTFAGPAGTGALVAAVTAAGERTLGQETEARDTLALLAERLAEDGLPHAATSALAALAAGETDRQAWLAGLTAPAGRARTAA